MKVVSVVGARPNFIKLAPLSKEIRKRFCEIIVHTGQHYDYEMNKLLFESLELPQPDYHLDVGSGTHSYQTGKMLMEIEKVLIKEEPDIVIVFGDTNSTLAGALAAAKLNIPVAHVEAGVRSYDKCMPEEINRVLVDHLSSFLFCPTKRAVGNLKNEGITTGVYLTGDVMVDTINQNIKIAEKNSRILESLRLKAKKYILATVHRAENTDDLTRLKRIVDAFIDVGDIVFPCHPRTEKKLREFGLWKKLENNVRVIKPVSYLDMLVLEKNARKIITDSGGVQKEAYIFKVPCITLRETTEWTETVDDEWNVLVGVDREKILWAIKEFEPAGHNYSSRFGNGRASKKIVRTLKKSAEK